MVCMNHTTRSVFSNREIISGDGEARSIISHRNSNLSQCPPKIVFYSFEVDWSHTDSSGLADIPIHGGLMLCMDQAHTIGR